MSKFPVLWQLAREKAEFSTMLILKTLIGSLKSLWTEASGDRTKLTVIEWGNTGKEKARKG